MKREYNRVAHELAHIAKGSQAYQVWVGVPPPALFELIQADCKG